MWNRICSHKNSCIGDILSSFTLLNRRNKNDNTAFIEHIARRHHVTKSLVMQKGNVKLQGSSPSVLSVSYLLTCKERERKNTELQTICTFKAQLHIKTHRRTILTNPLHKMWQKDTQPSRKRATGTKRQKPAAVKVPIFHSKFHSSNRYIISNITVNLKTLIYQQSICETNITLIPHCFEGLMTTRYIMLHLWIKLWSNS